MNARDYTNSLAPFNASNGTMPFLRRFSTIDLMDVVGKVVIEKHIAAARPYLNELADSDERIKYLRATQDAQPAGLELSMLALDELVTEAGIDAIIRWGMVECNEGMDINGFMATASDDDKAFIYNVFAADMEEKGEKLAKAGAKKTGKKRKPRKKPTAST